MAVKPERLCTVIKTPQLRLSEAPSSALHVWSNARSRSSLAPLTSTNLLSLHTTLHKLPTPSFPH